MYKLSNIKVSLIVSTPYLRRLNRYLGQMMRINNWYIRIFFKTPAKWCINRLSTREEPIMYARTPILIFRIGCRNIADSGSWKNYCIQLKSEEKTGSDSNWENRLFPRCHWMKNRTETVLFYSVFYLQLFS